MDYVINYNKKYNYIIMTRSKTTIYYVVHHFNQLRLIYQSIILLTIIACFYLLYQWIIVKQAWNEPYTSPSTTKIPKVIMQTSKDPPKQYIIDQFYASSPDWTYIHFDDDDILQFFQDYPLDEFGNIANKFRSIKGGAHKADLFRYYYLYIKGGVFIDSDAMIQVNMDDIVKHYEFFSANSECNPGTIFQGFLGAVPQNDIIYRALVNAYHVDQKDLDANYFHFVKQMHTIVMGDTYDFDMTLYKEQWLIPDEVAEVYDTDSNTLLLKHYCATKTVPE